jgi:hypothetical protein
MIVDLIAGYLELGEALLADFDGLKIGMRDIFIYFEMLS